MNKRFALLASVAALGLAAPAFAADVKTETNTKVKVDTDGNYEAKTKTSATDAAGTDTTAKKTVDVDVNADGSVDKTVTTTETKDPKGLLNKSKVKTKEKVSTSADGTVTHHKKVVNGDTVEKITTETH